jgi:hypothetical protein
MAVAAGVESDNASLGHFCSFVEWFFRSSLFYPACLVSSLDLVRFSRIRFDQA